MSEPDNDPLWYKDAIVYELYVRSFFDSDADGFGDFRGLTQKLDYLSQLGVTCLWLLPFYPSPMRDGGYDISHYDGIHPDFGTMRDFRRFIRAAHERGLRIITELVVNHTSDQHPWFQRARAAPRGSAARNMYVWSDDDQRYAGTRIIFTDTETSNWAWDPVAGQYYWHRFFSHQPDLNYESARVRRGVERALKFWLDAGVDGVRLDAVPYLMEREGTNNENLPETHAVLKDLRRFVDERYEARMLLAEANQWPDDVRPYFGDGDECHMAFHFPVMPRLFMALRQEDRHPIVDILDQTPEIPESCQWGLFLRNHDELTLEMVTDTERDYMYSVYASEPRMRVNVGIRRRLAPLLDNNRRAIELLHSLLFSLPGTPVLYYGDELGMGDNIFLGDRDGVRTPMQWTGDRNAGFSQAEPARLYMPVIMDPLYGYQAVNVEAQERSPSSLLNWMRRMITYRRERKVFGRGTLRMLQPSNRSVLAFVREHEAEAVLVVANLSRFVQPAELDLSEFAGVQPVEVLGKAPFPPIGEAPYFLSLGPHAFLWFDLQPQPEPLAVAPPGEPSFELSVARDWHDLLDDGPRRRLEREALPAFLRMQRWFGGKERAIRQVRLRNEAELAGGAAPAWLVLARVEYEEGDDELYSLPLAVATGRAAQRVREQASGAILSAVTGPRGRGVLYDATVSEAANLALVEAMGEGRSLPAGAAGAFRGKEARAFKELHDALDAEPAVERNTAEQSNSSVRIGRQLILKWLRRLEPGPHPEVEAGRHLAAVGFAHTPRLAGTFAWEPTRGKATTLALLQELAWNQGDGWSFTLGELARFLEEQDAALPSTSAGSGFSGGPAPAPETRKSGSPEGYADAARTLGLRTAELHLALSAEGGEPEFAPEPMTRADLEAIVRRIGERLRRVAPALRRARGGLTGSAEEDAATVLAAGRGIRGKLRRLIRGEVDVQKLRCHGDYHLGQVLYAANDFLIIDFEGEVGLPLKERRRKTCALTDVAGMLRSFDYAASVALRDHAAALPESEAVRERLALAVQAWERAAAGGFMAGYLDAAAGAPFIPADQEQLERWLDLFLLDKALHELEYELSLRPDWVEIPLRGVAALLRRLQ